MTELVSNFSWIDWVIVAIYLGGTIFIGLLANRHVRDMADYVVAGRSLRSFISIATMLGSEIGLVTVMYTSQSGFVSGFSAFHVGIAGGVGCLLVGLTGFLVVPLRTQGVMTIPEFYGKRYGHGVRIFGGLVLGLAGVLNMGVFLKAGAIFLTSLTGMTDPLAVKIVMTVLLGLVLFYTILGGMVSVVITDYVQFVVLAFGLVLTCILAFSELGWESLTRTVREVIGESGFDPFHEDTVVDADGNELKTGGFGIAKMTWLFFSFGIGSCAVWPTAVMRVCSAKDERVVRRLYTWSSIGFMTRFVLPQFLGVCALAFLWQKLGAGSEFFTASGELATENDATLRAMPVFLGQILPVGVIGLIGAGMLAAFMSTHDSYLLCWASVFVEDVINPIAGYRLQDHARLKLARILIFLIGLFLLAWGLWFPLEQNMIDYLAVSGGIYVTGAFTLLVAGLYTKWASRVGAYLALGGGTIAILGLSDLRKMLGFTKERMGFELDDATIGLGAIAAAVLGMVLGSVFFPDSRSETDDAGVPRS